ncbi:hypothetical protein Tco_0862968 [Tanacetum coccineum]
MPSNSLKYGTASLTTIPENGKRLVFENLADVDLLTLLHIRDNPITSPKIDFPPERVHRVMDSDFLVEEVDTFLVSKDSIPPGIESDLDSEGDIVFLDNLLNDDPIPD